MSISTDFLKEIERNMARTKKQTAHLQASETGAELRENWEDFLTSFARSIGKIITAAKSNRDTRGWGCRLKNASTKDDPGLVFLRESRNVSEHGLEPIAEVENAFTSLLGGYVKAEAGAEIHFHENKVNGIDTGSFVLSVDKGRVSHITGTPRTPVAENPATLRLIQVNNPEKGVKTVPPHSVFGRKLDKDKPIALAVAATKGLREKLTELISSP